MMEAMVVFHQGRKLRVDVFRALYGNPDPIAGLYDKDVAASLDLVASYWPSDQNHGLRAARLYDGLWQYESNVREDKLVAREPRRSPERDVWGDDDIADFAWKTFRLSHDPYRIYEDDFSAENDLLAMEMRTKFILPVRQIVYVDPKKDYVCQRSIHQKMFEAPWHSEEDKQLIEAIAIEDRRYEESSDWNVIEYGQTSTGQWYPKVIEIKGYRQRYGRIKRDDNRVVRIHLITENPDPMPDLFDPDKLPKPKE